MVVHFRPIISIRSMNFKIITVKANMRTDAWNDSTQNTVNFKII